MSVTIQFPHTFESKMWTEVSLRVIMNL